MRFAAGTAAYEWADASRPEPLTSAPDDVRRLAVRAWYPAAPSAAERAPYFLEPRSAELNATLAGLPADAFSRFEVTAALDAEPASSTQRFPVLIFSPGMSTPAELYGRHLAELASHGFVIFALSHPYATGAVVFANGNLALEQPEAPGLEVRDASIASWSVDQRFALSQVERLAAPDSGDRLAGRLALDRAGVLGHSRGGAAAALSCRDDPRFTTCANLDGSVSTALTSSAPQQPFLLMRSELGESTLDDFFQRLSGPARRVDVTGAGHNDFSDLPQLAAELAARGTVLDADSLLLGALPPERSQQLNTAVLAAFFGEWLQGRHTDLFIDPPFTELRVQSRR